MTLDLHVPFKISIHASAREATQRCNVWCLSSRFQSTPPRGRRRNVAKLFAYYNDFNPRLREGGDDRNTDVSPADCNFNPRLREGGDSTCISIHCVRNNFNPRLREGGDNYHFYNWRLFRISIHASAREATSKAAGRRFQIQYFNPRLREGGDGSRGTGGGSSGNFNPRLREGGDRRI